MGERQSSSRSVFHAAMEQLKKESQAALERSAQKSQQMEELLREKMQLEETLAHRYSTHTTQPTADSVSINLPVKLSSCSENRCDRLTVQLANQKAEFSHQLQSLRAELDPEGGALQGRLEERERRGEKSKFILII